MSSRFISAGKINADDGQLVEQSPDDGTASRARDADARSRTQSADETAREREQTRKNEEWEAVQRELDAERRRREEAKKAASGEEKSLFAVLEANKAAKQAAFEEKNKIRNQFRPLDDDEIGFLDDVRAASRAAEDRVRSETEAGLEAFRAARRGQQAGSPADEESSLQAEELSDGGNAEDGPGEAWDVSGGRKRKRDKDRDGSGRKGGLLGIRRRKSSQEKDADAGKGLETLAQKSEMVKSNAPETKHAVPQATTAKGTGSGSTVKLGLVSYGSDDDEDD